jgi:diguanylate cyclase (GGDEF)-like protein
MPRLHSFAPESGLRRIKSAACNFTLRLTGSRINSQVVSGQSERVNPNTTTERSGAVDQKRYLSSDEQERARLAALRSYCVRDTGHEARFDDLTSLAASICETPVSLISFVDANRLFFKSAHGLDAREVLHPDFFCSHAIRQSELFVVPDAFSDPRFARHPMVVDPPGARFYAGAPLVTPQGHALGTLSVIDFIARQLQARQAEILRILARQVMTQLELTLQAMRDPLTGLYNHRPLEETLRREILRARRIGSVVGVMAVDIDHFKRVNDMLGHEAGDEALRGIAQELARCVREEDIACRSGGEEFIVIFPGTGGQALHQRAEAVRRGIEKSRIRAGGGTLQLTVSIGLATFPANGETDIALLRAADAAQYEAKAAGRNRVIMCAPDGTAGFGAA